MSWKNSGPSPRLTFRGDFYPQSAGDSTLSGSGWSGGLIVRHVRVSTFPYERSQMGSIARSEAGKERLREGMPLGFFMSGESTRRAVGLLGEIQARGDWRDLEKFFGDDAEALKMVTLIGLGMRGAELRRACDLDPTQYDTVRKRVVRKLAKYAEKLGSKT